MVSFERGFQLGLPDLMATQAFASILAKKLNPGLILYLHGDLGAGKTTLVRSILATMGYNDRIKSPTYTLVEEYTIDNQRIYHFDLYRINSPIELEHIGINDYNDGHAILMFEWADKGLGVIPQADLEIILDFKDEGRSLALIADTDPGMQVLKAMTIE